MFFLIAIPTLLLVSTFLLFIKTPLTIGFCIFVMAFLSTIITASIMPPWFAYLLFLIYVRGILVIFAYFVAISPNQKFSLRPVILSATITSLALSIIIYISPWSPIPLATIDTYTQAQPTAIYAFRAIPTLALIGLILLLALLAAVKLATRRSGAIRPFKRDLFITICVYQFEKLTQS